MALPTTTQTLNNLIASTAETRRPGLLDNFFGSAPVWARLYKRENVKQKGGFEIRVNHTYAGFPATSYGRGDEFNTEVKEFATSMIFNWKFSYVPVNLHVIDVELNDSAEQVFDLVEAAMENGELSLIDEMSRQIFADGSGNASKDFDGLANAVSRSTSVSYGGISRTTTGVGSSILAAAEDTSGSVLSLANVNTNFGSATVARKKPDLMITTQTIWNRIWERSQPSERNRPEDDREIGFETVRFNGASVVVDSHCPSGFLYLLNTEYWELYLHTKWDFKFRGFMEQAAQQLQIGQLIVWGNLLCRAPRFQAVMSSIT